MSDAIRKPGAPDGAVEVTMVPARNGKCNTCGAVAPFNPMTNSYECANGHSQQSWMPMSATGGRREP